MAFTERARVSLIINQAKTETKQVAGLLHILHNLVDLTLTPEVEVVKDICPRDGCLLFESDPGCPACKHEIIERSKHGRATEEAIARRH